MILFLNFAMVVNFNLDPSSFIRNIKVKIYNKEKSFLILKDWTLCVND